MHVNFYFLIFFKYVTCKAGNEIEDGEVSGFVGSKNSQIVIDWWIR